MLSEQALVLIAIAGVCVLLILGFLELIWPSKPRRRVPRDQPETTPLAAPQRGAEAPERPAATVSPQRKRRSKVSPHARTHAQQVKRVAGYGPISAGTSPTPAERRKRAAEPGPWGQVVAPPSIPVPRPEPEPPPAATSRIDAQVVETCFSLYQEQRYDEALSMGEGALAQLPHGPCPATEAHDVAALWSVVALTRQELGDDDGASAALDAALGVAPSEERATYQQHIAALSLSAARSGLARAARRDTDDPIAELRQALGWVEHGRGAVPDDERLAETREAAHTELWSAYEEAVHGLLQRQEFREARRLLREALDDPAIPAGRVGPFEELLSGTFDGEIGQLTAQAIRSVQETRESEALASLRRADDLLATIAEEALPPKRREEVNQRLWWGYTRLGVRRVEAGEYEGALDPLMRALRFADITPDRQAETRAALVRALDGVADVRALSIRELIDRGDRDEAVLRVETLRTLLQSCEELGLSTAELSATLAKTQRLCEELGMEDWR